MKYPHPRYESWSDFYQPLGIEDYLCNIGRHRFFIKKITERKPEVVLEVGTGSGSMSIFLSTLGMNVVAIDNDIDVIRKARENCKKLNGKVELVLADALHPLPFRRCFEVAFSQGVAEHFTEDQIRAFVKYQLDVSMSVMLSVPNKYYYGSFGDEKILSIDEWKRVLKPFNVSKIRNYGKEFPNTKRYAIKKILFLKPHHLVKPHHILIEVDGATGARST